MRQGNRFNFECIYSLRSLQNRRYPRMKPVESYCKAKVTKIGKKIVIVQELEFIKLGSL